MANVEREVSLIADLGDHAVHQGRTAPYARYRTDADGNPTGGHTSGVGIEIEWQDGVKAPTGAILEDLIAAARDRLVFFQESRFACEENAYAIWHLEAAVEALNRRTKRRKAEGTEGSYKV